jgi:hypothetical protein
MAMPKAMDPQTDFSAGQLNVDMKRSDNPILRAGARQLLNFRILHTGRAQQRPGRRIKAILSGVGRVDQVLVLPGLVYLLSFTNDGTVFVSDSNGVFVAGSAGHNWSGSTVWQVVWTLLRTGGTTSDVLILFPGAPPVIARFDGVSAWTFPTFGFQVGGDGIPLAPYYRIAAPGATLVASGATGAVLLTTSAPVFKPQHAPPFNPAVVRYANRRLSITAFIDTQNVDATWLENAYPFQRLTITAITGHINVPDPGFVVGQLVQGATSNVQAEITNIDTVNHYLYVQCIDSYEGFATENVASATSAATVTAVAAATPLQPILTWDEQMISDARGWPQSCSTDQNRLVLCDLPSNPEAVIWSAIGQPYNLDVGAEPSQAMVEPISGKPRVYHVVPGDGGEVVFTNRGIFYVPISEVNPLKPGSVVFRDISPDAASKVRPTRISEGMLYISAGQNRVVAIIGSGSTYSVKPYDLHDVSRFHNDIIAAAIGICTSTGDGTFDERYVYVTNSDGTVLVGQVDLSPQRDWLGFVQWRNPYGFINWVSTLQAAVLFTGFYASNNKEVTLCELLDETSYLDAAVLVNALPAALVPGLSVPPLGPIWWLPGAIVDLMDGAKDLGPHQVDQYGNIIPIGGEDLSSPTLNAGIAWTSILEPFAPQAAGGQSVQQRLKRRRVARFDVSVENSTGFLLAKLYSRPTGPYLPAPGAIMQSRRIAPYNQDDDASQAPTLREQTYSFRTTGRSFDPRVAVIKDTPGPIRVLELGMDITV